MLDIADIQGYIFGSNNLQQNLGASELVTQATRRWIFEVLRDDLKLPHNGVKTNDWLDYAILDKKDVAHELAVEVIYAGGGNAALLFAKDDDCRKFVRQWTRRVFEEARGLQPVVKSTPIDWTKDVLKDKLENLRHDLYDGKVNTTPAAPLLGLGVTAACVFTGLPATKVEDDQLISTEAKHKIKVRKEADERLRKVLLEDEQIKKLLGEKKINLEFVYNFDEFGTRDEFSYMAVIHADGNRMGERIKTRLNQFDTPRQNDACVIAWRNFSKQLQDAAKQALQKTVAQLLIIGECDADECLPFRPIVFGGDDVTFVSDGRLGLSLASAYLQEFTKQKLADGEPASARAGVAIMKSHFPFSRSYELADRLCDSAKERREKLRHDHGVVDAVTMDWHFSTTGIVSDLEEIRQREYTVTAGELFMRPIVLPRSEDNEILRAREWRTWSTFNELVRYFKEDAEWKNRRNKAKALREALRAGPEAVELFLVNYIRSKDAKTKGLLPIEPIPYAADKGWEGPQCVYFDAIEAMDFFTALEGNKKS
jgi:hypothetical protein